MGCDDNFNLKIEKRWAWWCTPLIPAFGKQKQEDLCEFKASFVYKASSRTTRDAQRNPVSKKKKKRKKRK